MKAFDPSFKIIALHNDKRAWMITLAVGIGFIAGIRQQTQVPNIGFLCFQIDFKNMLTVAYIIADKPILIHIKLFGMCAYPPNEAIVSLMPILLRIIMMGYLFQGS